MVNPIFENDFPDVSVVDEASDFKIGTQLGFANPRPIITSHAEKNGRGPGLGSFSTFGGYPLIFLQRLKLATLNVAYSWVLQRPIIKSHPEL